MTEFVTVRHTDINDLDHGTFPQPHWLVSFPFMQGYVESALHRNLRTYSLLDQSTRDGSSLLDSEDNPTYREAIKLPDLLPRAEAPEQTRLIGEWEGMVEQVTGSAFSARIVDLIGNRPEEVAEFDIDDVATDDQPLVVPGGLFYWTISRTINAGGRPLQSSELRFRRLIVNGARNLERAQRWAASVTSLFEPPSSEN
jgi:hypothetical protein